MFEQFFTTIVEGLPTAIITGVILGPPAWILRKIVSLALLKRRATVSRKYAELSRQFHETLEKLVASPTAIIPKADSRSLYEYLNGRLVTKASNPIIRKLENLIYPSVAELRDEYNTIKNRETTGVDYDASSFHFGITSLDGPGAVLPLPLYKDVCVQSFTADAVGAMLVFWSSKYFTVLPSEYRYMYAKGIAEQLERIHASHVDDVNGFLNNSLIFSILPSSLKKRLRS